MVIYFHMHLIHFVIDTKTVDTCFYTWMVTGIFDLAKIAIFVGVRAFCLRIWKISTRDSIVEEEERQVGDRKEGRGGCTAGLRRPPATASITMAGGRRRRWPP
jgi:hypothetical protein